MTDDDSQEMAVMPAAQPMRSGALDQLEAHVSAMASAQKLGAALASTDMVPADYKGKPGNAAAAILYGAEIGLNPIQSLQQIFIVHGRPTIYARTAVALVNAAGITVETVETGDKSVTVRAHNRQTGQVEESTWDIARATLAGYTGNKKYVTNPQEMLYAKAAMEVCRKIAPSILLGIVYSKEEMEIEERPAPVRVHSARPGETRGLAALRERAAVINPPDQEEAPE